MWPTLGFIGAGQMARALAIGFSQSDLPLPREMPFFDPFRPATDQFQREVEGASLMASNAEVVGQAELIFVAVKPQCLADVGAGLRSSDLDGKVFVSILAGVSIQTLSKTLGTERVIRVMPNTPCLVSAGAAAFAAGAGATADDARHVRELLNCVGVAIELAESQLDAVTGLSGSGPAYVFMVIEALSDGGVRMGLPRAAAMQLAAQTVLGAAKMVMESSDHPAVLRDRVTSPGGTTSVGIQMLERGGLRAALMDAVEAAADRSRELGRSQPE